MGPLDKAKVEQTLVGLRARGKTPLALSIEDAISDLGTVSDDKPVTLVLLTDGGEDTPTLVATAECRRAPRYAKEHPLSYRRLRHQPAGLVAAATGDGTARPRQILAGGAVGRLATEHREWSARRPRNVAVLDANGKEVEQGRFGETKQLPEGKYTSTPTMRAARLTRNSISVPASRPPLHSTRPRSCQAMYPLPHHPIPPALRSPGLSSAPTVGSPSARAEVLRQVRSKG